MSARRKVKQVRRRRAKKALAAGLMFPVTLGFAIARDEKVHIELPSYPEMHGEYLETMMSTATWTHHGILQFDMPTGPQ
jgi:hypothetical protein